jgi:hypothetical protein
MPRRTTAVLLVLAMLHLIGSKVDALCPMHEAGSPAATASVVPMTGMPGPAHAPGEHRAPCGDTQVPPCCVAGCECAFVPALALLVITTGAPRPLPVGLPAERAPSCALKAPEPPPPKG